MARLSSRRIDRYRKAVDDQADLARAYVQRALDVYFEQNPGCSTADGRNFAIELLKASMPNFCDAAGTLAADFFDEVCASEGIEAESQLYDTTDYSMVKDKVRYFARKLNGNDVDAFKREVVAATHYFVKRSAYDNMVENCRVNTVRYARVPSGFETCPFCFMLASRGFVYHSEVTAKGLHGYHGHCDCCIVPGAEGRTKIEGYDPEGMAERWDACARTIGSRDPAEVMKEVATRDWQWLYTGEPPSFLVLEGADPNEDEKDTARRLAESGYKSIFRPTRSKEHKRTSDVYFKSGLYSTSWEFKAPHGNGNQTISHQFEEAAGQSKNLVIDMHWLGESWTEERVLKEAAQKLNRKQGFKIPHGEHKGETWYFDTVLILRRDKSVVKLRRS